MCGDCRRGEPCACCLAEHDADYSTLFGPGHVMVCVPNHGLDQPFVGAFGRAVIQAHKGEAQ